MTKLLVVRHGNTFSPGEAPRRVGRGTDLPLVSTGVAQAKALGHFFKEQKLLPTQVFAASLQRTLQTAQYLLNSAHCPLPIHINSLWNEIDYGPDENQPEENVVARIGHKALDAWHKEGLVPPGWHVDTEALKLQWKLFFQRCHFRFPGETILVVTSGGIAKFSPYALQDPASFLEKHDPKMKTGAFSLFTYYNSTWSVETWNQRPQN